VNGVHDMGGMDGLGPVAPEADEPIFHEPWEARALALTLAMGAWGRWNIDATRRQRELIPGPDYLRMNYYEIWITALVELMVRSGLVTRAEIESGRPSTGGGKASPPLMADRVAQILAAGAPVSRSAAAPTRFRPGDAVRARNLNPPGHTRLPRYVRGRLGRIERDHGVHVFPDSNAGFQGEAPQRLYQVRFSARELWGPDARARDCVCLDLWDGYLEPA
jgi:nitrile hydratase